MSAPTLQLAPTTNNTGADYPGGNPAERPAADAEACVLSALMQNRNTDAADLIIDNVRQVDFDDAVYGNLYRIVAAMIRRGAPADYAMVAHQIDALPETEHHHREPLRRRLVRVIDATAYPERATHYAKAVVAQSLRRTFTTSAEALNEAATGAVATDNLYEYMCHLGRTQREHQNRYETLTAAAP